jgi:hypothetical protein
LRFEPRRRRDAEGEEREEMQNDECRMMNLRNSMNPFIIHPSAFIISPLSSPPSASLRLRGSKYNTTLPSRDLRVENPG